jgi:hypothetical protein
MRVYQGESALFSLHGAALAWGTHLDRQRAMANVHGVKLAQRNHDVARSFLRCACCVRWGRVGAMWMRTRHSQTVPASTAIQ